MMKKLLAILLLFTTACVDNSAEQTSMSEDVNNTQEAEPMHELNGNADLDVFTTYIKYEDELETYDKPNGEIYDSFKFETDPEFDFGRTVSFDEAKDGWLRINEIISNLDVDHFKGKWIQAGVAYIGTRNYANQELYIYENPSKNSKVIGSITHELELAILDFQNNWVLIEHNSVQAWLDPSSICTLELANCN